MENRPAEIELTICYEGKHLKTLRINPEALLREGHTEAEPEPLPGHWKGMLHKTIFTDELPRRLVFDIRPRSTEYTTYGVQPDTCVKRVTTYTYDASGKLMAVESSHGDVKANDEPEPPDEPLIKE